MILHKTARCRHLRGLLQLQCPSICRKTPSLTSLISHDSSNFLSLSSVSRRPFSLWGLFRKKCENEIEKCTEPLSAFFKGAVDRSERIESSGFRRDDNTGNGDLKEKLMNLEEEVRSLNKESSEKGKTLELLPEKKDPVAGKGEKMSLNKKPSEKGKTVELLSEKKDPIAGKGVKKSLNKKTSEKGKTVELLSEKKDPIEGKGREHKRSLSALFANELKPLEPTDFGNEDTMVHKELSSDMQMLTRRLYMGGYLKDASFMPKDKLDLTCFEMSYAREFLKFASVKFAKDHQQIAKWLSASDLKKVAQFGCPSLGQRTVVAAKHMRKFFGIDENKVCRKCPLSVSCKHASKGYTKDATKLHLASVTRVLIMYAMESVPQKLVVPDEINNSVSRLLNEIVNLSQPTSSAS